MPEAIVQRKNRRNAPPRLPFDRRLALNHWMLHLFEAESFEKLGDSLRDPTYEGFDEENVSRFYHVLKARLFERQELSADFNRCSNDRNSLCISRVSGGISEISRDLPMMRGAFT